MNSRADWITRAKCRTMDPHSFDLSDRRSGETTPRPEVAQQLCEGCPVVRQCALDAMEPLAVCSVRAGVWIPPISPRGRLARDYVRQLAVVAGVRAGRAR